MNKKQCSLSILFSGFILFSGCATNIAFVPDPLSEDSRAALASKPPLLLSIVDRQPNKEKKTATIESIKKSLTDAYGPAIEWVDPFQEVDENRISVQINIKDISSDFGVKKFERHVILENNRTTAVGAIAGNTRGAAIGDVAAVNSRYAAAVAVVTEKQQSSATVDAYQGFWVGSCWLEIVLHDPKATGDLKISIAEQRVRSNSFGYSSGREAGNDAWHVGSTQLIAFLDETLKIMRKNSKAKK